MTTREDFTGRFQGTDAIAFENQALSIGREFLPPCALAVLDGAEGTSEYWDWLCEQETDAAEEWAREQAFQAS
jgi:hypothetical protein